MSTRADRTVRLLIHAVLSAIHIAAVALLSTAVMAADDVPDNAQKRSYSSGWKCDPGYFREGGGCAKIDLPPNAFVTERGYGDGWRCRRGFKKVDGGCVEIEIPAGAYLDAYGEKWRCGRGFRRVENRCDKVQLKSSRFFGQLGGFSKVYRLV